MDIRLRYMTWDLRCCCVIAEPWVCDSLNKYQSCVLQFLQEENDYDRYR